MERDIVNVAKSSQIKEGVYYFEVRYISVGYPIGRIVRRVCNSSPSCKVIRTWIVIA